MWVASGDAHHVLIEAVVFLDMSLSVPVVERILPNCIVKLPLWHLKVFPKAEDGVDDDVLVSNAFLAAAYDWVTDSDVLEVTSID